MARAVPQELPRRRARRHPRPLLPRQRGRVDLRGRPRPPLPLQGQLLHLPGDQGRPHRGAGPAGRASLAKRMQSELEWVRSSAQGAPGQEQGASGALRGDGGTRPRASQEARLHRDSDPRGPAPGVEGPGGRAPAQAASATACSSTTCRSPCRATASWASSVPTAWARPRCSRRSWGSSRSTAAPSRSARRSRSPTSTRTARASTPTRTCGRSSPTATTS